MNVIRKYEIVSLTSQRVARRHATCLCCEECYRRGDHRLGAIMPLAGSYPDLDLSYCEGHHHTRTVPPLSNAAGDPVF